MSVDNHSGRKLYGPWIYKNATTFGNDQTAVAVIAGNVFLCATGHSAPRTITIIGQGEEGQVIIIKGANPTYKTTIADSATIAVDGNWVEATDSMIMLILIGTVWYEIARNITPVTLAAFMATKAAASGLASLDVNSKLVQSRARADNGLVYTVLANDTLAQAYATNKVTRLTVTNNRTLTTTIPPAGCDAFTLILTSGVTSYTITFGAGFKPTATLATGTVSARIFVIHWISDGTNLYEASRSIAMVA